MDRAGRYPGPASLVLREQWRRDRRAIVRRHHPDLGGDPVTLQQRLRENDQRYRRLEEPRDPAAGPAPHGPLARRAVRALRARIPRGWPGHRRYIDL